MTFPTNNYKRIADDQNLHLAVIDKPVLTQILPNDMLGYIFSFLNTRKVLDVSLVCKRWSLITSTNTNLWKNLFYRDYPSQTIEADIAPRQAYKTLYRRLQINLEKGIYASSILPPEPNQNDKSHISFVVDGMQFSTNSEGIDIKNLITNECRQCPCKHEGTYITSFLVNDGNLITGDAKGKIKIWNLTTNSCTTTLEGGKSSVRTLSFADGKLISASLDSAGSQDYTIKVWDFTYGKIECINTVQLRCLDSLVYVDEMLIASYREQQRTTIKIWKKTEENIEESVIFRGKKDYSRIYLSCTKGKLLSIRFDSVKPSRIKVWNLTENKIELSNAFTIPVISVSSFTYGFGKLFIGDCEGNISIVDFTEKKHILLKSNSGDVQSTHYANGKLLSSHKDGTVCTWDFIAPNTVIFEELAISLSKNDARQTPIAMDRFSRMSGPTRKAIYSKLTYILKSKKIPPPLGKFAFHGTFGNSSVAQKAQAIFDYLAEIRNQK